MFKPTKVPIRAKALKAHASSTNPKTWCTYEEASKAYRLNKHRQIVDQNGQKINLVSGIGFALGDGIFGIDFDHVPVKGDELDDLLDFIEDLNTYAEWSPGDNIHVLGLGTPNGKIKNHSKTKFNTEIEVYGKGRYFTITGDQIEKTPSHLSEIDLDDLVDIVEGRSIDVVGDATDAGEKVSRHDQLLSHAVKLAARDISPEAATEGLIAFAKTIGLDDREPGWKEVKRMVEAYFGVRSFESQVNIGLNRVRVQDEVRIRHAAEIAGDSASYESKTVTEINASEDEEAEYAIDELFPLGGIGLLTAQFKAGKTSLALSLCKALCDGEPFLGFPCQSMGDGTVVYFNYELVPRQFERWVRRLCISNGERMVVKHMRGRTFPFWLPEYREALVEDLQDDKVDWMIIDTQIMAAQGMIDNENDSMQMVRFQTALEQIKQLSGANNLLITNHMGWASIGQEYGRSRGSTQQEGGVDVYWRMTMDGEGGGNSPRSLSALGRDVDLAPIELSFDKETGIYSWDGSTRIQARFEREMRELAAAIRSHHQTNDKWPTAAEVADKVTWTKKKRLAVLDAMVNSGYLVRDKSLGRGGAVLHVLTDDGVGFVLGAQHLES